MNIPENLIYADSALRIFFADDVFYNQTASSIIIEGSRNGFLSLSNILIYSFNNLEEEVALNSIPFVSSDIDFAIQIDEKLGGVNYGTIVRVGSYKFIWKLSENETNNVSTALHSLGHLNSELHLDSGKTCEEISVYCVVSKVDS